VTGTAALSVLHGQTAAKDAVDGIELLDAYDFGEIVMDSDDEVYWVEDNRERGGDTDSSNDTESEGVWQSMDDSEDEDEDACGSVQQYVSVESCMAAHNRIPSTNAHCRQCRHLRHWLTT